MYTTPKMRKLYGEIRQKLFFMIPEKWEKVYLYASVTEGYNKFETGEMYFYYFPKGILKKEPVNVYEVPNKFNIDDNEYFKLADELYGVIKKLRNEYISINDEAWSNVIISIENFKFKVEYGFEDLKKSHYSSYDRHIIFRYMYLNTSINSYNKRERNMIESYIRGMHFKREKKQTYIEPIYKIDQHNIIEYQKEGEELIEHPKEKKGYKYNYEITDDYKPKTPKKFNKMDNFYKYEEKEENSDDISKINNSVILQVKQEMEKNEQSNQIQSQNQILNFDKLNNKKRY